MDQFKGFAAEQTVARMTMPVPSVRQGEEWLSVASQPVRDQLSRFQGRGLKIPHVSSRRLFSRRTEARNE